jgi:dimethylamine monooxygenase subunit A
MPFDFDAAVSAPFRMQPGLRPIAPGGGHLTPSRLGAAALAEKLDVLRRHPAQALCCQPGFDPTPALDAVVAQAIAGHPAACAARHANHFEAKHLGWSCLAGEISGIGPASIGDCLRALPRAWRLPALVSLAFAEDLAVLDGNTAHIPWLAVCLPSGWAPEEKIGRHFAQVHAPVADNTMLLAAADHLARLVSGEQRWERFVWTIASNPRLAQHPQHAPRIAWPPASDASADELAARAWFRTEHQTFVPVPGACQAVFTIHVESHALTSAVDSPCRAQRLHDAIASMSPAVLAYRGLTDARERLLVWLASRSV